VRQRAAALGIEPEILATRRDLAALELGAPPEHLQNGWRALALKSEAKSEIKSETNVPTSDPSPL
jgi:hypothetical protein